MNNEERGFAAAFALFHSAFVCSPGNVW